MTWMDLVVLTLAASGALEAWFRGSLFASTRAVMQGKDDAFWDDSSLAWELPSEGDPDITVSELPWWLKLTDVGIPNWVGAVLSCALCSSYHATFWLGLLFWAPSLWLAEPWSVIVKFPLYALAATRAGNILTALLPAKLQYEDPPDARHASGHGYD